MRALILIAVFLWQQLDTAPATGIVSGTVFYSDGSPAANLPLRLMPVTEAGEAVPNVRAPFALTDAQGVYREDVPPGRYIVGRIGPDITTYYPGVATASEAQVLVVAAGSIIEDLNFTLPSAASGVRVQGRVILPSGYPIEVSTLSVRLRGLSSTPVTPEGFFEFHHVLPGYYPLTVTAPAAQGMTVVVGDADVSDIEFRLPPLIQVGGVVTVDGNNPQPRVALRFLGFPSAAVSTPASPYETTVAPGPNGAFSVLLPVGVYRVSLNNLQDGYYLRSISSRSTNLLDNLLNIVESERQVRIDVAIGTARPVRVSGRVIPGSDADGMPRKLLLTGVAVDRSLESPVEPDGSFSLTQVMPGPYHVRLTLAGDLLSAPVPLVVPARDLSGVEVPIPGIREVFGRIAVDGNGPSPKFSLLLVKGAESVLAVGITGGLPSVPPALLLTARGESTGAQVLQVSVNALPDGTFSFRAPDGDYRVAGLPSAGSGGPAGIPPEYFIRSVTAGAADLMNEPLRVSEEGTPEIYVGFGTTDANPWVRVSGRVTGLDTSAAAYRVSLEGDVTSAIEAFVDSEGAFEFPAVLRRSRYTARLIPDRPTASTPRIAVADENVTGVEVVVSPERDVTIRTVVEGDGPVPDYSLSLRHDAATMNIVVRPQTDGRFTARLPEDERRLQLGGLPLGYAVKSITYGSTELRDSMKLEGLPAAELTVTLAVDPDIPWGRLRGRVNGLDPETRDARLVLNGAAAFSRFETPVGFDGTFEFSRVPQGMYLLSLEGAATGGLTPSSITVDGPDPMTIEVALQRTESPSRLLTEEAPSGATISDAVGGVRQSTANEAAAVASLRTINTAQVTYLSVSGGRYGSLEDLIDARLLDASFRETKAGFRFSAIALGSEYAAAAVPAAPGAGRYGFYSAPDAIVRYTPFEPLAPSGRGGAAVQ